ncbi:hypothetical protein Tco_0660424 [Tanacetum coccineum]
MPCVTSNVTTPKVSAFEKYVIDVEPIPPRQRNNREVHHGYLNSLRNTLDILREIVEEARCKRPSDNSLEYACVYTKQSHELLEKVSVSCPKAVNKRDKFIATTHITRKKHVTFANPLETSGNNRPKHVKQHTVQKTNVPINHSTGVSNATKARSLNNLLLVIDVHSGNFVEVKPHQRSLLLLIRVVIRDFGEYSFGGACEKSTTILLTYAEYFTTILSKVVYTTSPWKLTRHVGNDTFSLHDDEELSLHDDASLDGSVPASNKGDNS